MNPDKRIWNLYHPVSGDTVTFEIYGEGSIKVTIRRASEGIRVNGHGNGTYLLAAGRNMWDEYIRNGYRLQTNSKLNKAISKNKKLMAELNYALEA
jgi:hypothetical protein